MLFDGSRDNDHVSDCDGPANKNYNFSCLEPFWPGRPVMFRFLLWTTQSRLYLPFCPFDIFITRSLSISISLYGTFRGVIFDQTPLCRYVGMSVYNVTIMCVLGVAISAVLNEHPNASFVLISVFIIFCTTGTLCLVFVPKVAPAYFLLSFSHYLIGLFPSSFLSHFLSEI